MFGKSWMTAYTNKTGAVVLFFKMCFVDQRRDNYLNLVTPRSATYPRPELPYKISPYPLSYPQ